tara:strand:+ start:496 stop:1791 length:1296 start_codon:yes stop_codon:yes gene_type:complete
MKNVRAVAAQIITNLTRQRGSLSTQLTDFSNHPEISLLQEICFGTCRWYLALEFLLHKLVAKPIKEKDQDVKSLILVGLYQLKELNIADHAVVNETVAASTALNKPWAKPLINAVLRKYQRNQRKLTEELEQSTPDIRYSCPSWLLNEVNVAWKSKSQSILKGNNQRPPLTLRVNISKKSPEEIISLLSEHRIEADRGKLAKTAIYLEKPLPVEEIPGFYDGWVSIQDESSQLVPELLNLKPKVRVLDACSAPGGKTCAIIESERLLTEVVALDESEPRLQKTRENLRRSGLMASLIRGDATKPSKWWDGRLFDRILLDAPCSGSGVIRRHPDIKILRREEDIHALTKIQAMMLDSLWQCLRPDGLLLYTTCSILPRENDSQIKNFLKRTDNAKYEGITADWGVECDYGRQLLVGDKEDHDGFFYSLLSKS